VGVDEVSFCTILSSFLRCCWKLRDDDDTDETGWQNRDSFFAHATTILETSPRGKNYLDVVESFITTSLTSTSISTPTASASTSVTFTSASPSVTPTPLSLIQIGRQPPTSSTNILSSTQEIECWVRDCEQSEHSEQGKLSGRGTNGREGLEVEEKRTRKKDEEETKQENGKKRRRIKEAKKRDLLELLGGCEREEGQCFWYHRYC
jgi:hypothetical protein